MRKLLMSVFESRVVGGVIAAAGIISLIALALFGLIPGTTPLALLVVVLAAYTGGRRVGVASAVAVGVFSQMMFGHPGGWGQLAVLYACAVTIAYVVGHLRHIYRLAEADAKAALEAEREAEKEAQEARLAEAEARAAAAENQWKADLVDEVNGNLKLLERIHKEAEDLFLGWHVLSDEAKRARVDSIRGGSATLRTMAEGWHAMYVEREALKAAYGQLGKD